MGMVVKFEGFLEVGDGVVYFFEFGEDVGLLFVNFEVGVVGFGEEFGEPIVPGMDGGGEGEEFGYLFLVGLDLPLADPPLLFPLYAYRQGYILVQWLPAVFYSFLNLLLL